MVCRPSENFMKVYRSVKYNNGLNAERSQRKQKYQFKITHFEIDAN